MRKIVKINFKQNFRRNTYETSYFIIYSDFCFVDSC
jgi:hypothetical protein